MKPPLYTTSWLRFRLQGIVVIVPGTIVATKSNEIWPQSRHRSATAQACKFYHCTKAPRRKFPKCFLWQFGLGVHCRLQRWVPSTVVLPHDLRRGTPVIHYVELWVCKLLSQAAEASFNGQFRQGWPADRYIFWQCPQGPHHSTASIPQVPVSSQIHPHVVRFLAKLGCKFQGHHARKVQEQHPSNWVATWWLSCGNTGVWGHGPPSSTKHGYGSMLGSSTIDPLNVLLWSIIGTMHRRGSKIQGTYWHGMDYVSTARVFIIDLWMKKPGELELSIAYLRNLSWPFPIAILGLLLHEGWMHGCDRQSNSTGMSPPETRGPPRGCSWGQWQNALATTCELLWPRGPKSTVLITNPWGRIPRNKWINKTDESTSQ